MLGGNGTIEDFSPLPRLYRDAVVFESWEGTHNVLCAQVQRDCVRLGLVDPVLAWVSGELAAGGGSGDADAVRTALDALEPRLRRSLADPEGGAAHFRRHLDQLTRAAQAACLLREAREGADAGKGAAASLFVRRHLVPGHVAEDDPTWRNWWKPSSATTSAETDGALGPDSLVAVTGKRVAVREALDLASDPQVVVRGGGRVSEAAGEGDGEIGRDRQDPSELFLYRSRAEDVKSARRSEVLGGQRHVRDHTSQAHDAEESPSDAGAAAGCRRGRSPPLYMNAWWRRGTVSTVSGSSAVPR